MTQSAFSPCDVGTGTNVVATANKNWTPGPWVAMGDTNNDQYWDKPFGTSGYPGIVQRLENCPEAKGAMLRYHWTALEGAEGDYSAGFAELHSKLNRIAALSGRRLMVFIQLKTSGAANAVPAYMRNSATYADGADYYNLKKANGTTIWVRNQGSYNGQYAYESSNGGPGGFIPNMHVDAVRARFQALLVAYAAEFNDNPYLEAIHFSEASIACPIGAEGLSTETKANGDMYQRPNTDGGRWTNKTTWYNRCTTAFIAGKAAFDNVQFCQWINADRSDMEDWVPDLLAIPMGLGMTDACFEEKGFHYETLPNRSDPIGSLEHLNNCSGLAMIATHFSVPAMNGTVVGRCQTSGPIQNQPRIYPAYPGVGESRQTTYDKCVSIAKATHVLIRHSTALQPSTGQIDPNIPGNCDQNPYTAYAGYAGRTHNAVTDEFLQDPLSDLVTNTDRPAGWG